MLDPGSFMPHATCYLRDPGIIWLHVTTDLVIGFSYVAIASTLGYLVYRASKDIPFHWVFLAFGTFIISCGFTHFMEVLTVWQPLYWLAGYVKGVTAIASAVTAVALFPLVPKVFGAIARVKAAEEQRLQLELAHERLAQANKGLAKQKAELEAANRDLEMFAHSIAHDLKAPARAVVGFCEILREEHSAHLDATGQALVGRIVSASRKAEALLRDLLQYTAVSRTDVDLQPISTDLIIKEALAMIESDRAAKQGTIVTEVRVDQVLGSPALLLQVLINLIGNALKYIPVGTAPAIRIVAEERGEMARISVRDNGLGIPPSSHDKIFEMFVRLHSQDSYAGTGIGLAIVRRAVERMRGQVGLESSPGKGSTFWIELPRVRRPDSP